MFKSNKLTSTVYVFSVICPWPLNIIFHTAVNIVFQEMSCIKRCHENPFNIVDSFGVSSRTRNITGHMREPKCTRKYSCLRLRSWEILQIVFSRTQCVNWKPNLAHEQSKNWNTCHCWREMNGSYHLLQVQFFFQVKPKIFWNELLYKKL